MEGACGGRCVRAVASIEANQDGVSGASESIMAFNQTSRLGGITALLLAIGFLSGCSSTSRDVTGDRRYTGGFQAGQTYRLTDNASLIRAAADHWQTGARYYVTRPACADSIQKERPNDKPIASLPPGTH